MSKSKGITSILNKHYSNNTDHFIHNSNSENLKTVMLKIGEVPNNLDTYYDSLPKYKKQRAAGIKKLSTKDKRMSLEKNGVIWEDYKKMKASEKGDVLAKYNIGQSETKDIRIKEKLSKEIEQLIRLDQHFRQYFDLRRQLLGIIWEKQGGVESNLNSVQKSFVVLQEYEYIYEKRQLIHQVKNEKLTPNDVYNFVKKTFEADIHNYKLDRQFLSNLWSDVASQYHGYINKVYESNAVFENNKNSFLEFLELLVQEKKVTDKNWENPFGRSKNRSAEIYPSIFKIYSNTHRLDITNYNKNIAELKKQIKLWYDQFPSNDDNPIQKYWNDIVKFTTGASSIKIGFNHEKTFPKFKDYPKLKELLDEVENFFPDTRAELYKKKLARLSQKNPTITPFREAYLTIDGVGKIAEELVSPNARMHRYWTENSRTRIEDKIKYVYDLAIKNEDEIYAKFNSQPNSQKEFILLRELAGWIAVRGIVATLPLKAGERDGVQYKISLICSKIQNCTKEFEADSQTESIYLSGMYRDLDSSCSYLCTNKLQNKLFMLIDFENSIQEGSATVKTLIYTHDKETGKAYIFDKNNPDEYVNYNKPLWKNQSVNLESQTIFNLPLCFGKNQERKYFWNNNREGEVKEKVHNIFDPNSRLKVSSMRLIRKFNPIRKVWEYYLSLAIYRLEDAKGDNLPDNDTIIGIDIGENTLVEFQGGCGDLGSEANINLALENSSINTDVKKHISGYDKKVNDTIKIAQDSMKKNNYILPEIRQKLRNKTRSIKNQTAGFLTKAVLSGFSVQLEDKYKGDKNYTKDEPKVQIMNYLQKNINPTTNLKLAQEVSPKIISSNSLFIKIEPNKKLGIVPTECTSQLCSRCGHISKNYVELHKIDTFMKSNLSELDLKSCIDRSKVNILLLSKISSYNTYINQESEDSFLFDLSKLNVESVLFKLRLRLQQNEEINHKDRKFYKEMCEANLYNSRPSWFYKNSETFRCLVCGYFTECDKQASLTIARYRYYLDQKFNEINYEEKVNKNTKILQQIKNLENPNFPVEKKNKMLKELEGSKEKLYSELLSKIVDESISKSAKGGFEIWYQSQLAQYGYNNEGNALWNLIQTKDNKI